MPYLNNLNQLTLDATAKLYASNATADGYIVPNDITENNLTDILKAQYDLAQANYQQASTPELTAGTETALRSYSPANLNTAIQALGNAVSQATESTAGIARIATNAEALAGTDDTRIMTPLKVAQVLGSSIPVGATLEWRTASIPTGFLECDGSAVSRTTYSGLFSILGTQYGVGDGSTTFNIPDDRGQFKRGWDHGAGVDPDAGTRTDRGDGTTGDNMGTKQADELESHTHGYATQLHGTGGGGSNVGRGSGSSTYFTNASGGAETRPLNTNVMFIIKY